MIGGTWQGKTPLGLHELRGFQKGYSAGERKACSHQLGAGWWGGSPQLDSRNTSLFYFSLGS